MYQRNDKHFDRLFRKAAEQFDLRTTPTDWESLEERLKKEALVKRKKVRKGFLWFFLWLSLITDGGFAWMLIGNSKDNIPKTSIVPTELFSDKANEARKRSAGNVDVVTANPKRTDKKVEPETDKNKTSGNSKDEKSARLNSSKGNKSKQSRISTISISKTYKETFLIEKDMKPSIIDFSFLHKVNFVDTQDQSISVSDNLISKKQLDLTKTESDESPTLITKSKQPPKGIPSNESGFEFGVVAGVDNSKIKSTGTDKLGYNIGLQVGYRLSNRWSLNTGVIFTRKNYDAAGKDYYPPKNYWTNYVDLKRLSGYCEMWDIPLNVCYNFTPAKRLKWFASTGLSTYVMRKQFYEYFYVSNNVPGARSWTYKSQQNHWLSVLNISTGFEKRINRSFSIQAEPFAKIPLAGLGFGKMKIGTYGTFLILKYRSR